MEFVMADNETDHSLALYILDNARVTIHVKYFTKYLKLDNGNVRRG